MPRHDCSEVFLDASSADQSLIPIRYNPIRDTTIMSKYTSGACDNKVRFSAMFHVWMVPVTFMYGSRVCVLSSRHCGRSRCQTGCLTTAQHYNT